MNVPKFGPRDCLRRLIYKVSSQKIVAFVFAAGAMMTVLYIAVLAKAMTADVAIAAVKAVRDVAIALLAARGVQTVAGYFGKNGNGEQKNDDKQKP